MAVNPLSNEKELLAKIANRDQHAFKIIFDHYRPLVYTFSLKYLKSTLQAEEAVQEIFLKIWRLENRLLEINDLENFILTVSRNKSIDMLRRMKLEVKHVVEFESGFEVSSNDTEEAILLKDTKKILDEAIALLPPQQKLVYTLCHVEGRKQEDVAKELQLSPETIKRHSKLALKFIRNYLDSNTELSIILIILKLI